MKEERLDLRKPNLERLAEVKRTSEVLYKLNNTLPFTDEFNALAKELFTGGIGEKCYVAPPLYMNIAKNIHILSVCQQVMFTLKIMSKLL